MIHELIDKKINYIRLNSSSSSSIDENFVIGSIDFSVLLENNLELDKIDNLCEKLLLKKIKSENNIGSYSKINKNDITMTCPICLESFKEGLYKRILSCSHIFHKKCIDKWIKNSLECSCPICRKTI